MKLVLFDPAVDRFVVHTGGRESMIGFVPFTESLRDQDLHGMYGHIIGHGHGSRGEAGSNVEKKLLSELLTKVSPLTFKIELERKEDEREVNVLLFSDTEIENRCVLRRLRDRFQDRVRISMAIEYKRTQRDYYDEYSGSEAEEDERERVVEDLKFASMQEMRIEYENGRFICKGNAHTFKTCLDFSRVILKIDAEIPDEKAEIGKGNSFSRKIFESGTCSDITILAGNGAEIKAHKNFLSVCSPVLEAMFQNEMSESQTGRVDMSDISKEGVQAFLRFVYYGDLEMPKEDMEIAFELFYASHKYNVPKLEEKMVQCLMDAKNKDFRLALAFKVYMFVRGMESVSAVELKRKCIQIFNLNMDELESLPEYLELFEKTPKVAMEVSRDFLSSVSRRQLM